MPQASPDFHLLPDSPWLAPHPAATPTSTMGRDYFDLEGTRGGRQGLVVPSTWGKVCASSQGAVALGLSAPRVFLPLVY